MDIETLEKAVQHNTDGLNKLSLLVLGNGKRGMDEVQRTTEELVKSLAMKFEIFVGEFSEYKSLQERKEKDALQKIVDEKLVQDKEIMKDTKDYNRSKKLILYSSIVSNLFIILSSILVWLYKIAPVLEAASK